MRVKPGVRLLGVKPETVAGMQVVESVFLSLYGRGFLLTSCVEGTHLPGSLHYVGLAFDGGTHEIAPAGLPLLIQTCRDALGADWDVVLESQGTPNEHLHFEFQPKTPLSVQ